MAVQVIRRDVEHDGDFGTEGLNRLQLEAGISSTITVSALAVGEGDRRGADVAAHQGRNSAGLRISPAKVVVVVLPFDPVMATIGPGELRRQFDLADDRFAELARLHQRRRINRNTRADHDQVLVAKGTLAVASGLDRDAMIEQSGNLACAARLRTSRRRP